MCQAHDGEYRAIVSTENRYSIHGFVSALASKERACPGPASQGAASAWYHGYDCALLRGERSLLPWGVELCLGGTGSDGRDKIRMQWDTLHCFRKDQIKKLRLDGWIPAYEDFPSVPDPRAEKRRDVKLKRHIHRLTEGDV